MLFPRPLLVSILLGAFSLTLCSCKITLRGGFGYSVQDAKDIPPAQVTYFSPRPSEVQSIGQNTVVMPVSSGGSIAMRNALGIWMFDRFDERNNLLWRKALDGRGHPDFIGIHVNNGKLIVPSYAENNDTVTCIYTAIGLKDSSVTWGKLAEFAAPSISPGASGEDVPVARGFRRYDGEIQKGDPHLILSPRRKYSMLYHYNPDTKQDLTIAVYVFDTALNPVRKESINLKLAEDEVFTGMRLDDEGAIIASAEREGDGGFFQRLKGFMGSTPDPTQKLGVIRTIRYAPNSQPQTVISTPSLDKMYSVTKTPAKDGKYYVAALKADGDDLVSVGISAIDYRSGESRSNKVDLSEEFFEKMVQQSDLENTAVSGMHIDVDRNRLILVIEEFKKNTRTPLSDVDLRENKKRSKDYWVAGNLLILGFDLAGKLIWSQGIRNRAEVVAEGLGSQVEYGYENISSQSSVTKAGDVVVWFPGKAELAEYYNIIDGKHLK
jgi:hypothetical protein